jgi:hypothetical protein
MARPSKTAQELGYLEDTWRVFRTLQAELQGVVTIYGNTSGRPGIYTWRFVFTPLVETAENYLGSCAVQFDYPRSASQTLAGAFLNQALELQKVAQEAARAARTVKRNGG